MVSTNERREREYVLQQAPVPWQLNLRLTQMAIGVCVMDAHRPHDTARSCQGLGAHPVRTPTRSLLQEMQSPADIQAQIASVQHTAALAPRTFVAADGPDRGGGFRCVVAQKQWSPYSVLSGPHRVPALRLTGRSVARNSTALPGSCANWPPLRASTVATVSKVRATTPHAQDVQPL